MSKRNYVRERQVNQKLTPYAEKTKFVLDTLIDAKNNNPGSTINNDVIKEVNMYLYNWTQKKVMQIRDSIRYNIEVQESQNIDNKEIAQLSLLDN